MKTKLFITRLFIAFLILPFGGCKKEWLDVKPDQSVAVPASLNEFQALLDNTEVMNMQYPHLQEVASDGYHFASIAIYNSVDDNVRNAYTWSNNAPYIYEPGWRITYQKVLYCNIILEGLKKINLISQAERANYNNIKGQALFHRAKCFYDLSQVWAPAYNLTTAQNDLGIPLRLEADVNLPSIRSTVKENYEQILADLVQSKELLPDLSSFKTRPSKTAVFGLLARIYLSMENYSLAKQSADSCLKYYDNLLDYNLVPNAGVYPMPLLDNNPEVIFHCSINTQGIRAPQARVDTIIFSTFNDNDIRKTLCFTKVSDGIRYKGFYAPNGTPFGGLTTAEIYLIRAECYARANDMANAKADLDTLIKKRWKNTVPYQPVNISNAEDALIQTLIERKKELLFRGLRWSDLRRLNRDNRFKVTLTRNVDGIEYTLEPNSYKYTFPIPDDVIQNTGMQQNSGWD